MKILEIKPCHKKGIQEAQKVKSLAALLIRAFWVCRGDWLIERIFAVVSVDGIGRQA